MRMEISGRRKRWLSLILTIIMVGTMLMPVTASADVDEYNDYTVVLHANRPNKVFDIYDWNTGKTTYKAEYTETREGYTENDSFDFSRPSEYQNALPAGYAEWDDGYEFAGWAKSASGPIISKIVDEDDYYEYQVAAKDLTANGTTHLYAQWKKTAYVVTFDAGKQGYFTSGRYENDKWVPKKFQKYCDTFYMSNPAAERVCDPWPIKVFTPTKYAFDGWYYDAAYRNPVPDAGFTVTKDVTLYAKYIDKAAIARSQSEGAAAKAAAASYYNKAAKEAGKLKVSEAKASAAGKKKANVKWKANKKASGYQIQYSLKKNFKNAKTVTVKGAKKKVRKLKGMKKGKTYYIRIRTYQNVLGVMNTRVPVYGKWSRKMKVKVK